MVTLAIILADEHAGPALKAKDHEHDDKKRGIDHRGSGDLILPHRSQHHGVGQGQGIVDQVLQGNGQSQMQ